MIRAQVPAASRALARRLARKAARLAEARAENALLARRDAPRRWRQARLLWPLFTTKD